MHFIHKKNFLIIFTHVILYFILIIFQLVLLRKYTNFSLLVSIYFIASTFIYFAINIYITSRTLALEKVSNELESEKLLNKSLTIMSDNIRAFKHDFNNIIQSIGGYIRANDMEGLQKYYYQLLDDCQKTNNISSLNPDVINNPAIYNLLAVKYYKAEEMGIHFTLDIFINLNKLNIKIYELTRILGILIDNAIEATKETTDKLLNVKMKNDVKNNRQLIIIENSYIDKDINLDKIFEKSFSTKPNNTGLGLWEIRQILKKSNNLNLFTSKNERFFIQQLEIY